MFRHVDNAADILRNEVKRSKDWKRPIDKDKHCIVKSKLIEYEAKTKRKPVRVRHCVSATVISTKEIGDKKARKQEVSLLKWEKHEIFNFSISKPGNFHSGTGKAVAFRFDISEVSLFLGMAEARTLFSA